MRQLFICTSTAVLADTGKPQDLTNVAAGTIGMWQNDDDSKWLAAAPAAIGAFSENAENFGKSLIFVALGEGVAIYGLLISILIINTL